MSDRGGQSGDVRGLGDKAKRDFVKLTRTRGF